MKEKLLVVCPGRGTYNASELGYLQRHHGGGGELVARLDAYRASQGQPTISQLDGAEKYSPSLHMPGDNASLLIYACALADFAAIDRERFEVVAVTGNSMGWYLALACASVVDFDAGARLVNNMGGLMHEKGQGGQLVWSMADVVTPKLRLVASVPPIDWNTRSTGAPCCIACRVVLTCVRMHDCVGIAYFSITLDSKWLSLITCARLSVAGLMPITASPQPYNRPSRMLAAIPFSSSVGWFGCKRLARRPGRPAYCESV